MKMRARDSVRDDALAHRGLDAPTALVYDSGMNVVRDLRHRAGLTQELLARAVGIHSQSISRYEVGRVSPTLRTLVRLADAVGLDLVVSFAPKETETSTDSPVVAAGSESVRAPRW